MEAKHSNQMAIRPVFVAVACALLSASSQAQVPEAVLVMDSGAARTSDRTVEVIRAQMMRIYRVVPAHSALGPTHRDAACETKDASIVTRVRTGSDLFFEHTDLDGAAQVLDEAVTAFLERPCVLRGDEASLREVCAGAVLLVRIHLLLNRAREAQDLASRIAVVCPRPMVEASQEPPEVLDLVLDARVWSREVGVVVQPSHKTTGARVLFNGFPLDGKGPWPVRLSPGMSHEVAILTTGWGVHVWRGTEVPTLLHLDLDLSDRVEPGPENALRLSDGLSEAEQNATVRQLADSIGRTVLFARTASEGWVRVEEVVPGRATQRELLRLRTLTSPSTGVEVVVEPEGPLLSRPSWPWPYIAAGAAAGLLGVGIYLNVAANRDAKAVNRGEANRVEDYWTRRNWAIACYALAGASGATAIALFLLRPEPKDRFVVFGGPWRDGAFLRLGKGF